MGGFDDSGYCNNVYSCRVLPGNFFDFFLLSYSASLNLFPSIYYFFSLILMDVRLIFLNFLSNYRIFIRVSFQICYFSLSLHADNLYGIEEIDVSQNETILTNKQITVSTICIMETIKELRIRRAERNKCIQIIIRIVDMVMDASTSKTRMKIQDPKNFNENENENTDSDEKLSKLLDEDAKPYNAQNQKKCQSIISPEIPFGGELRSPVSVLKNDVEVRTADVSNEIYLERQLSQSQPIYIPSEFTFVDESKVDDVCPKKSETSEIDPLGPPSDLLPDWSKRIFSATLRENMERDRVKMNSVQREIRDLSEKGQVEKVEELIIERTALAVGSITMATELYEQIHDVRAMQETRQKTLTSALLELESLFILNRHAIVSNLESHEDQWTYSPATLSGTNSDVNVGDGLILPMSSSVPASLLESPFLSIIDQASGLNQEQCSWSDWIDMVDACTIEVTAIDPRSADTSIELFKAALDIQTKITSKMSKWLNSDEIDSSNALEEDTNCQLLENVVPKNDVTQNGIYENVIEKRKISLAEEFEENLRVLDKCRMSVKCAVDLEIENIVNQIPQTNITELKAFHKGCGVLNNLILQNRLDIMDTVSMGKEIDDWLEVLTSLKDPNEVRTFIL